jgi:glycosyltransferase involved in cell wall biosynthesis
MATFNGAEFIDEQIKSLVCQTYTNWHLYIGDDGSTDDTKIKIRQWSKIDSRIVICEQHLKHGSALGNFSELCKHITEMDYDIIFFCDQDDVWLKTKIETVVLNMRQTMNEFGENVPVMAHNDLKVINSKLQEISPSFIKFKNLNPQINGDTTRLVFRNVITGCASAINRSLLNMGNPISNKAIMHDWWFALIAASCGKVIFVEEQLNLYRQHNDNVIGATRSEKRKKSHIITLYESWKMGNAHLTQIINQCQALENTVTERTSTNNCAYTIKKLSTIKNSIRSRLSTYQSLNLNDSLKNKLILFLRLLTCRI